MDDEGHSARDRGNGSVALAEDFEIRLGDGSRDQDQEWCEVTLDGERRRIRFHDYHEVYAIPGLYEELFYEQLECASPRTLRGLLGECLERAGVGGEELRVFDLGAGNGMMGEELAELGVRTIVGADLLEEAAAAAERDRPGVYDGYFVGDLTAIDSTQAGELAAHRFNCLTTVAALGFGDIPPAVFARAAELVEIGGWLVFNIKEEFLSDEDETGFSRLIRRSIEAGAVEVIARRRYRHRLSTSGEPIHYEGVIARKRAELPRLGP